MLIKEPLCRSLQTFVKDLLMLRLFLFSGLIFVLANFSRAEDADDPFRWLEEVTSQKALQWVRQQNEESVSAITQTEQFSQLNERLLEIYNSDQRIPYVSKSGAYYYNFWRDAQYVRGLWRRTTLDEYRKAEPNWETMLDLDQLAKEEDENWVWEGATFLEPTYERCLLKLSRGGADASVVREFDVTSKSFVAGGFKLPEAKSRVAWRDIDSVFVGTNFGPDSMTESGYPRIVKQWSRGTPLADAEFVYEGRREDVSVGAFRDLTKGFERDFVYRSRTFWKEDQFFRREGRLIKIEKPEDADLTVWRDVMLLELRSPWTIGDTTYSSGALLATDFEAFLKGDRGFAVLFQPTERKSLAAFSPTRHHIMLNERDNVRNRLYVLTQQDGQWRREPLAGAPQFSTVSAHAVDADESDAYFMHVQDYLTPPSLQFGTLGKGPPEPLKQNPAFFDSQGLSVSQHDAVSKDGTRIPYFQVASTDLEPDSNHPTLLYGYGGFEVPLVPHYQATVGEAWLEKGGVYVVANIRGGGEFGPQWHQAALKEKRHKAFEDFIAVAEDLIRRKVTSSRHLGIMGGSNGGLLVGNMLTMRPDLFRAIVCQVPLLDMQRYHKLLAGASWVAEYGDPDDPKQWEFIQTFSPYHNIKQDAEYPRVLFTTSTRDDRVHPGHARKMVARMKAMGHDVLYYENIEGGHGGAANNEQQAFMSALDYIFLWNELSSPNQGRME